MIMPKFQRPGPDEYIAYYGLYIGKVPEGDLMALYRSQIDTVKTVIGSVPESKGGFAYAPGKWTIKEVVGHLADCERVFSHRALRFARADATPLPGFDENAWMPPAGFNDRSLTSVMDEWVAVRHASITLFEGMPAEATTRTGLANNNPISVRALAYILPGHVIHHLGVLRERYLST